MKDKQSLLNELRALDFALLETGLYLNAYDCDEAKAYFCSLKEEREQLAAEYENHHGPLVMINGIQNGNWCWVKGPWPWESEAN